MASTKPPLPSKMEARAASVSSFCSTGAQVTATESQGDISASQAQAADEKGKPKVTLGEHTRPPIYYVNLDLPPRERYKDIGEAYKDEFVKLAPIFDEVIGILPYKTFVSFVARRILRRVYNPEEQEEIKGLVEVTGLALHLIIAFNTLLDTLMACTSGAVRLGEGPDGVDSPDNTDRMVHFRTLDWGMDSLRSLVIHICYQRGGVTVAQALTYAGFVGVLTGVRQGLSISLNFRPAADETTSVARVIFHKALVLLGFRRSVSSQLRSFLLPGPKEEPKTFSEILGKFPTTPCTPCYVTLCDGISAAFLEKDITHANITNSGEFVCGTNHDIRMEAWKPAEYDAFTQGHRISGRGGAAVDLLDDSQQRKRCIERMYGAAANPKALRRCSRTGRGRAEGGIGVKTVISWCQAWPITNECTHFSCIMDPKEGGFIWLKSYLQKQD
ncbi:hypothetical protein DRE_04809 [Drechslerella stenobrocha 248]|uniref:ceramidase n=1 Tax=Drechslerella stenobrocha 248 TaxID=1043628 RepID=W7HPI3_9PEZI|nr:hypothetical protein DRE_04809 [Drechslerella stenobrocha 248]